MATAIWLTALNYYQYMYSVEEQTALNVIMKTQNLTWHDLKPSQHRRYFNIIYMWTKSCPLQSRLILVNETNYEFFYQKFWLFTFTSRGLQTCAHRPKPGILYQSIRIKVRHFSLFDQMSPKCKQFPAIRSNPLAVFFPSTLRTIFFILCHAPQMSNGRPLSFASLFYI